MRTDLEIVQLPNPLPAFGGLYGKNIIQKDPDFSTSIVRLTDGSIDSYKSFQTDDAAQAIIWNTDDTLILAKTQKAFLFQFNPASMSGELLPYTYNGSLCFSRVNHTTLYQLIGSIVYKIIFNLVSGVWKYINTSVVCDFKNILPAGFKVSWNSAFLVSIDDTQIAIGFSQGIQDTGFTVCVYRQGSGYRLLNTQTGQVTGQWGTIGTATLTSKNTTIPFNLHEVYTTPNNDYVILVPIASEDKASSQFVWEVASLSIIDNQISGHESHGCQSMFAGGMGGGQLAQLSYENPTVHSPLILPQNLPSAEGQRYIGDRHWEFGLFNSEDEGIIWSTGTSEIPFVSAWQSELTGYDTVNRIVYRACHTFNSNQSNQFIVQNAIGNASQTGKFVAFTSDMMGNLGSVTGAAKGVIGKTARGDVFIADVSQV